MGLTLTFNQTTLPIRGPERVLAELGVDRALAALGQAVASFLTERRMGASSLSGVRISSHAPFATVVPHLSADLAAFDRWLVVPRRHIYRKGFPNPVLVHPSVVLRSVVADPDQQSFLSYRYGLGVPNRRGAIKLSAEEVSGSHTFVEMKEKWKRCRPTMLKAVRGAEAVFKRGKETELQSMLSQVLSFEGGMLLSDLAMAFAPITTEITTQGFYNWVSFSAALSPDDFGIFDLRMNFRRHDLEGMRSSSLFPWGKTPADNVLLLRNPQNIADLYAATARRAKKEGEIDLAWFMGKVRDLRVGRLWRWVAWAQAIEFSEVGFKVPTARRVSRMARDTKYRIREIVKQKGPVHIKEIAREYKRRFGKDESLCTTSYSLYINRDPEIICVGQGVYDWVGKPEYRRYRAVMQLIPEVERNGQRKIIPPTFNFVWAALYLHPEGLSLDALYHEVQALGGQFKKCTIIKVLANPDFRKYFIPPTRGYSLAG